MYEIMKESLYSLLNIEISFKFHASTLTAIYLKAVAINSAACEAWFDHLL